MLCIGNRGDKLNLTSLEEWMRQSKAPALEHSLNLFNELKARGLQIILVSSRREYLRSATINNLVSVGYHGWTSLILRSVHFLSLSNKHTDGEILFSFHIDLWVNFGLFLGTGDLKMNPTECKLSRLMRENN